MEKAAECSKEVSMGHTSKSMYDSGTEDDLNFGGSA